MTEQEVPGELTNGVPIKAQPKVIATLNVILVRTPQGEQVVVNGPGGELGNELQSLRMLAAGMTAVMQFAQKQQAQRIVLPFGVLPPVRPIRHCT